jgi:urease accessory protein
MKKFLLTSALFLLPVPAFAHTGAGASHGAFAGFTHPIAGLDHVLAMISVGFLAYVLGGRALRLVPAAFVAMMAAGGFAGMSGFELPYAEFGIGLSIVVIGFAAALGRQIPVITAMALVGVFAVFHGFAHGAEMPANASGLAYGAGFMTATALLHATGIAGCFAMSRLFARSGRVAIRLGAGAAALSGAVLLTGPL